ncbi:Glycosyltransferase involved in cell wall bisynthesis [Pustulibacterium marinum]|uniref:Glycosyltransferase involved in cell wall bisynthesis n=1 Tax=Pustulibacterium marinum TaxID=1224947 RepID=A0A1I7HVU7_9FLAO|nr:glycosyltransferase family 2 protein [Pustulibacterium marinum]SFU64787.1 Glycosyltransferase involved in cell wall bisynthesis [Pustulibacterium marinum]
MRQKISALVITLNEINNIKNCIDSLSFADEIVVIDSYSTDGTWEFLQKAPNITAYQHAFENYMTQRSYALSKTNFDWVLFIDADEVITAPLQNEILNVLEKPGHEVYYFYRQFIMNGKPLKYSGFQTDKQQRLFLKTNVHYDKNRIVHEGLIYEGSSTVLKNKLEHHFFKSEEDYTRRILYYGKLRGQELFKKGIKPTFFHYYLKPLFRFLKKYIIRLGILDGYNGYLISKINAQGIKERYLEVDRQRKEYKN